VNPHDYYDDLKRLARQVRAENGLNSARVTPADMRRIYFRNGIEVDLWPYRLRNLRGAFICDKLGTTVMLAKNLPRDPMVFTMAHELKHFYRDRDLGISYCDQSNVSRTLEIGAEVFAAELIFSGSGFHRRIKQDGSQTESMPAAHARRVETYNRDHTKLCRAGNKG